ncbi:MAG: NADH-quinone oxidoreductase subunit L [Alphaproteobacteria bacterium MarineAlpha9_Bin1]|nr:MAG: NADH-quinone oxidoreductase subunit L [Alphaproteobacteria bacterium MarineAlpha9_Bin1]
MLSMAVFLPLIGSILSGLFPKFLGKKGVVWVPSILCVFSFIISTFLFHDAISGESYEFHIFNWIQSSSINISWSLKLDVLSGIMLFIVSLVSSIIHIYSIGYMSHDPGQARFFSYLSLFTFSMLILVSSSNFVQLFLGWEGVGLCSYLLIGFWYKKNEANNAAIKAFIVNRIGDLGLILGICAIYKTFGSLVYSEVFFRAYSFAPVDILILGQPIPVLELIGFMLFIGAMGKSAQLGLHTWLADAMEGPTPVSALIHAATMVTAGVFLVVRCSPIYEYTTYALGFITIIGALTAIFAASIAITQNDIKKIIAYSTCSQLGYMFFACGVSAYSAGIFHLMTHAFFKALLFLGAGSVIHALSEQNIKNMGGLSKHLPFTCIAMWIGCLALAGIPPFAGFFSKDIILEAAWSSHTLLGSISFYLGIVTAFLTAFYSWRIIFLVFHVSTKNNYEGVRESPMTMLVPIGLLSFGAIFSGWLGLDLVDTTKDFWVDSITVIARHGTLQYTHHVPLLIKLLPTIIAVSGIALAWIIYVKFPKLATIFSIKLRLLYVISYNKYWFDEIYEKYICDPIKSLGKFLWEKGDIQIIDKFGPDGISNFCINFASRLRKLQSGYVYHYAFSMFFGLIIFISWHFLVFLGVY